MIITIIRIKNKIRKLAPSLVTNSLTYVCVSGGKNFFANLFMFIKQNFVKQNSLEWFEILKILMMTWAIEEHCLEINVTLIQ